MATLNETQSATTVIAVLNTSGVGHWASRVAAVNITELDLVSINGGTAELLVYFDSSWNVETDGLIYTDKQFKNELRAWATSQGYAGDDISYSEQGMQGDDFVSCDVGKDFIASWRKKHGRKVTN